MAVTVCGDSIPVLGTCPPDTAQILLYGVPDGVRNMGLITVGKLKECFAQTFFGPGAIMITGSQLNGSGKYFNSDLVDDLLVFACNIPNYLIETSQWNYITDVGGAVIGVQILIGYDPTDIFIIFPNPQP